MYWDGSIVAKPCCFFGNNMKVTHVDQIAQYRDKFSAVTDYDSGLCNQCQQREEHKFRLSYREQSFLRIPDQVGNDLVNLEVQIDTECNAACIMCSDNLSSQWKKLNHKQNTAYKIIDTKPHTKNAVDDMIKKLDLSRLQSVKILGGEPFYTDTQREILDLIPNKQSVSLMYITNGSIFPDSYTVETWKQFQKIIIIVSLEDMDERYEYVRWPLKWHQVDNNLQQLVALQNDINIHIGINYTANPLTIFYYQELENYLTGILGAENLQRHPDSINVDYARHCPTNLSCCPIPLREIIGKKYSQDHKISRLLNSMPVEPHHNMIGWLEQQQTLRNSTSWQTVFPEVAEYFKL
jgi:organic radical activating enzyme